MWFFSSASDQQDDNLPENNETLNNITISSTTFLNFNNRIARGEEEIFMGPSTAAYNPDCYSSTEYLEFCMRKGDGIGMKFILAFLYEWSIHVQGEGVVLPHHLSIHVQRGGGRSFPTTHPSGIFKILRKNHKGNQGNFDKILKKIIFLQINGWTKNFWTLWCPINLFIKQIRIVTSANVCFKKPV